MARRRRFGGMFGRRGAAKPKPIKTNVDTKGLKRLYTWLPFDEPFVLRLITDWWAASAFHLQRSYPLDAAGKKSLDRASKAAILGGGASTRPEKVHAFQTSVRLYEKLWASSIGAPLLESAEPAKGVVGLSDAARMVESGTNYEFGITKADSEELTGATIRIPVKWLESAAGQPPATAALHFATVLAQVQATRGDEMDFAEFIKLLESKQSQIVAWIKSSGSTLRTGRGVPVTPVTPTGQTPTGTSSAAGRKRAPVSTGGLPFPLTASITLKGKNPFKGSRGAMFDRIVDGMTVQTFLALSGSPGKRLLVRAKAKGVIDIQ